MAKKREGLVLSHTPKPAGTPLWLAVLVVGVCSVSDGLTIYLFSAQLFNETPAVSILISAVMACGLDVSLAVLGNILSAGRPDNKEARFRRKMAVIGLLTAFGLSFLALVLLAAAVSARNETDLLTDGTVARLIGPLVTSIISFFITFCMDPVAQRRACLDRQIAETRNAIEDLDVETNRLEQALGVFDCDSMDHLMEKAARLKIEILQEAAAQTIHEELAKRIDDSEASRRILQLNNQRVEHIAAMEAELNEILEKTDMAPAPEPESPIRIVEQPREQSPAWEEVT